MNTKKVLNVLAVGCVALSVISCGGKKEKSVAIATVKPEKVEISGDLSNYLQVVDNEYEVIDDWGGHLSIKVKAIKAISSKELKKHDFNLSASLLGANSMPVTGTGEFEIEYSSNDKLLSLLKNGSGEDVIQLRSHLGDYNAEKHADKVKKFSVSSTMKEKEKEEATPSRTASSIDDEDFDKAMKAIDKATEVAKTMKELED